MNHNKTAAVAHCAAILAGLALAHAAYAEEPANPAAQRPDETQSDRGFGLGVRAGTLGAGLEGTFGLTESLNLRVGANYFTWNDTDQADDISYDVETQLQTVAAVLDWHPFSGTFRLSAGIVYNGNGMQLLAAPTTPQMIGGVTYTPAQIGTLSGELEFPKSAPYVGFGWGNAARGKGFGMSFEVGALFQGAADVTLSSNGTLASDPTFQSELKKEEQLAEDDLAEFKIYPVIAFGISYRF